MEHDFDIASNTDIFDLIQTYANNLQCIIVCSKWKCMIMQKSVRCDVCKKITKVYNTDIWSTDIDDVTCHMYPHYKDKCEILNVNINDIKPLKIILEKLKDFQEIKLQFNSNKTMDIIAISVPMTIHFHLKSNYFAKFIIKSEFIAMTVNVDNINTSIKYFDEGDMINLSIIDVKEYKNRKYIKMKSNNMEYKSFVSNTDLYVATENIINNSYVIIDPTKILRMFENYEVVKIKYSEKGFLFVWGHYLDSMRLIYNDIQHTRKENKFAFKSKFTKIYLSIALNSEKLSDQIKLYIHNSDLLYFGYDIEDFGNVVTFLKPE